MANVSKLLHSCGDEPSFLKNLQLTDDDHFELKAARTKIRRCLRGEFAKRSKAELGVVVHSPTKLIVRPLALHAESAAR
jgi:hypothetical protein